MRIRLSLIPIWLLSLAVGFSFLSTALAQNSPPSSSTLDDVPKPFEPVHARTEAEQLRTDAMTLFATGRACQQREEYAEALRYFQRALRRDPASADIVRSVIAVAVQLDYSEQAVRYATKAVELTDADPLLLHRLGVFLAEDGRVADAIALYDKALNARGRKRTPADVLLRMEMGRLCHSVGKDKKAADCFTEVARAMEHPDEFELDEPLKKAILDEPVVTYQLMGESFLDAGRIKEAETAFAKVEKLSSDKSQVAYNRACICFETGKPTDALAALETSFAAHPADDDDDSYELLEKILAKLGKKSELIPRLEKLHAAAPSNAPLSSFLASRCAAAGDFDKAEAICRAMVKSHPTVATYRGLIDVLRQAKRYPALLAAVGECADKLGVLKSLEMESHSLTGDAAAMQGIEDYATKTLATSPDKLDANARLAAALLAVEAEHYKTAGELFEAALAAKPKQPDEVYIVWGASLVSTDHAAEAEKVFRRAIDANPKDANPVFQFYLAGALALEGKIDDALKAARIAAEKRPKSARFRARPAWVLTMGKRRDEAIKEYREVLAAFDREHDSQEVRDTLRDVRLALSDLYSDKGDVNGAAEWLEQVLDEFPDDSAAMNDLGYVWADAGRNLLMAKRLIEDALADKPNNAAYQDSLGWVLFHQGQYAAALTQLKKAAAACAKPDGSVLDHLGDAYAKNGQPERAVETWRKAADCFARDKEPEKEQNVRKKIQGE